MGVKFGEIDASQILDNEFRIMVLEATLALILSKNPRVFRPSEREMEKIREDVISKLREKYPDSGIELRNQE